MKSNEKRQQKAESEHFFPTISIAMRCDPSPQAL